MTVNSLTQTLFLQNLIRTQQQSLSTLQQQIGTGKTATTYSGLTPAQGGLSISLRAQIDRFTAYTATNATLSTRLSAADAALTSSYTAVSNLRQTLSSIGVITTGTAAAFAANADGTLSELVDQFNTKVNGVPLFAGQSGSAPIQSASAIEAGLRTSINGSIPFANVAAATSAIQTYFGTNGANLGTWSTASQSNGADQFPAVAQSIADGRTIGASLSAIPPSTATAATAVAGGTGYAVNDTITLTPKTGGQPVVLKVTSVSSGAVTGVSIVSGGTYVPSTANAAAGLFAPAAGTNYQASTSGGGTGATFTLTTSAASQPSSIQQTIQAVAAVAVFKPTDFANQSDYQNFINEVVTHNQTSSGSTVDTSLGTALNNLSAYDGQVGILQKQASDQQTVNQSVLTITQTNLNSDENIDPATAITNLQNLQNQLQATYKVTATLRGLSLVNYI